MKGTFLAILLLLGSTAGPALGAQTVNAEREMQVARAKSLQQSGDFPGAIRIYQTLLAKNAKDGLAIYELAFSHQATKAWQECIDYARRGTAITSDSQAGSFAVLAICQESSGNHEEALRTLKGAVDKFPNDFRARYNYALSLAGSGQLPEAMTQLEAAISVEPRYAPSYLTFGKLLDTYRRDGVAMAMYLVFGMIEPQTPGTAEAAARIVMILNRQVTVGTDGKRKTNVALPPGVSAQETALSQALATAALEAGIGNTAVASGDARLAALEKFMNAAPALASKEPNLINARLLSSIQGLHGSGRQTEFLKLILAQAAAAPVR